MLARALTLCLPSEISLAFGRIADWQCPLFAEEEIEIAGAVACRRTAFRAGRSCARAALAGLGHGGEPIRRAADGRPVWPKDVVGSITHADEICAAVVSDGRALLGLGPDLEPTSPVNSELINIVCSAEERAQFLAESDAHGIDVPKLTFVIKESIYKAYHPATHAYLDFLDVIVRIDTGQRTFDANIRHPVRPETGVYRNFSGSWGQAESIFFAVTAIPHPEQHISDCEHNQERNR